MTSKALPASGVEIAGATDKKPGEVPLTSVVVVVPTGVVVGASVVVVVELAPVVLGVAVDVVAASPTTMLAEVPDRPEEFSVTVRAVVSGSNRVTLTVATPPVKATPLPVLQSP